MAISITANTMRVSTHQTYNVNFFEEEIYTTVTDNPAVVTGWIDDIKYLHRLPGLIVGLDVEWRPSYSTQRNPVATLQLCVRDRCLVYQIFQTDRIPESLAEFLSTEFRFISFVGVNIKEDLEKLQSDYGIGGGARYVDLRGLAADAYGMEELERAGLKTLASVVLGKEVEKPREVTMSRWDARRLSVEQVKYACVDAYLSFEIGRALGLGDFDNYGFY
ncbi:3'-5' exonuclease-like [Salvia miltiorrhiza]|uniref:3'-5' exonuclease-like n=1 Tax=Salvia miltiorrhiza TaxID=226208 RepID=UPI0025AB7E23|nr:3'-5' exonuclease-like [Salvia miltiorrhiza]